jgi:hypothetical protein
MDFEISRVSRFRYRTRYFTHSEIIGSKEFVRKNYQRFKHLFYSKHEKKPKPIKGLDGMYSLKRLSAYSERFRPPIPGEAGHPFRSIPATLQYQNLIADSGAD